MLFDNYNKFINSKLKEILNKNQFRQLKITKRRKKAMWKMEIKSCCHLHVMTIYH